MTDLFRFVALRAPARTRPSRVVDLSTDSGFQEALGGIHEQHAEPQPEPPAPPIIDRALVAIQPRAALRRALRPARLSIELSAAGAHAPPPPPDPVDAAKQIVERFIRGDFGPGYIPDTYSLTFGAGFDEFEAKAHLAKTGAELDNAIMTAFGSKSEDLVSSQIFK